MMKFVVLAAGILSVAGCTTMDQREARCKCFNSDGSASGSCNFEQLPGQPAVFSFMASETATVSRNQFSAAAHSVGKEICGG